MKKIFAILIFNNLFALSSNSQSLIQQIHEAYKAIDSVMYIENIIQSYIEEDKKKSKESYEFSLILSSIDLNHKDSMHRKIIIDSLHNYYLNDTKKWREDRVNNFSSSLEDESVQYVLNLIIQDGNKLKVDTGKLRFNLFYFDNDFKGRLFIYTENGRYSWHDSRYRTFSRKLGRNAPRVFRRIMRKKPQYLLYCPALEGMNTILYMKEDRIFVYRIVQMKEYELNDYIERYGIKN